MHTRCVHHASDNYLGNAWEMKHFAGIRRSSESGRSTMPIDLTLGQNVAPADKFPRLRAARYHRSTEGRRAIARSAPDRPTSSRSSRRSWLSWTSRSASCGHLTRDAALQLGPDDPRYVIPPRKVRLARGMAKIVSTRSRRPHIPEALFTTPGACWNELGDAPSYRCGDRTDGGRPSRVAYGPALPILKLGSTPFVGQNSALGCPVYSANAQGIAYVRVTD